MPRRSHDLQVLLLGAAERWSRRAPFDSDAATSIRHALLRRRHVQYVTSVPAYARLAAARDRSGPQPVAVLVGELMIEAELFKSYDPALLRAGDFAALTRWLAEVSGCRPTVDVAPAGDLDGWRRVLATDGTYLTWSGGTSGRPSIVPRDAETLRALKSNGRYTIPPLWEGAQLGELDCLVLGPRGSGMGLQGAASGIARAAGRAHYLFDAELGFAALAGGLDAGTRDTAYAGALGFLRRSAREQRPVFVFGPPAELLRACTWLDGNGSGLRLPAGSVVLTGGGWKGAKSIPRPALAQRVERVLGVPVSRVLDAYSASELNGVLITCEHGRYHAPPTLELVVLDDLLEPIDADEADGTLGILDPFISAYPGFLLPGDRGRLIRSPCPCGLQGPAIAGPIERDAGAEARGCGGVIGSVLA